MMKKKLINIFVKLILVNFTVACIGDVKISKGNQKIGKDAGVYTDQNSRDATKNKRDATKNKRDVPKRSLDATRGDGKSKVDSGNSGHSKLLILKTLKAFPTALGAGASAEGGRGGDIYWVTNTNRSGTGSFFDAIKNGTHTTIMFAIGGTIPFDEGSFGTSVSKMTIAGQSAHELGGIFIDTHGKPSGKDYHYMIVEAPSSVFRYITTRGWRTLEIRNNEKYGGDGDPVIQFKGNNLIMDHFSDIGGVQGNCTYEGIQQTMQYGVYTESEHTFHDVGVQIYNNNYNGPPGFIDYIFNANLGKSHRFPAPSGMGFNSKYRVINNYAYGWGSRHMVAYSEIDMDIIGNLFQENDFWPNHKKKNVFSTWTKGRQPRVYVKNNKHWKKDKTDLFDVEDHSSLFYEQLGGNIDVLRETPLTAINFQPLTDHQEVKDYVLSYAGASLRFDKEGKPYTQAGLEKLHKDFAYNGDEKNKSKEERTVFQEIPEKTRTLTMFEKKHGFPESWAIKHELPLSENIHNETKQEWKIQGYTVKNEAGYTNLEIYLAELAGDFHMLAHQIF